MRHFEPQGAIMIGVPTTMLWRRILLLQLLQELMLRKNSTRSTAFAAADACSARPPPTAAIQRALASLCRSSARYLGHLGRH